MDARNGAMPASNTDAINGRKPTGLSTPAQSARPAIKVRDADKKRRLTDVKVRDADKKRRLTDVKVRDTDRKRRLADVKVRDTDNKRRLTDVNVRDTDQKDAAGH